MRHKSAPFHGMEDLGRMEAAGRAVAEIRQAAPLEQAAEALVRVVQDAQAVFLRQSGEGLNIADVAVDMDGHKPSGARSDFFGRACGIKAEGFLVNIRENDLAALPEQGGQAGGKHRRT
jgi:hypothetical protein